MVVIYIPVPQQYIKFLIFSVRNFSWKILCHAIIYLPVRLNISNALECKLLQNLALKFRYGIYKQLIISPCSIYFKKNSAASQHNVVNPSNESSKGKQLDWNKLLLKSEFPGDSLPISIQVTNFTLSSWIPNWGTTLFYWTRGGGGVIAKPPSTHSFVSF
jgi:hypothetical protein